MLWDIQEFSTIPTMRWDKREDAGREFVAVRFKQWLRETTLMLDEAGQDKPILNLQSVCEEYDASSPRNEQNSVTNSGMSKETSR